MGLDRDHGREPRPVVRARWTWGIWGVAVSTLVTDALALAWIVPRFAAPAAGTPTRALVRAIVRPLVPALAVAAVVLVGVARLWEPQSLLALAPLGILWAVTASAAMWRFGLEPYERRAVWRVFGPRLRPARVAIESR